MVHDRCALSRLTCRGHLIVRSIVLTTRWASILGVFKYTLKLRFIHLYSRGKWARNNFDSSKQWLWISFFQFLNSLDWAGFADFDAANEKCSGISTTIYPQAFGPEPVSKPASRFP